MTNDMTFRPLEEEDLPQAVVLINAEYARKKNEDYFRWQYFDSYYPAVLMGAFEGDTLIGIFGLQKKELSNGALAGQAIDLLTTPQWRGKGLFKHLGENALAHFTALDLLCVFPNPQGRTACERALGWTTIGKIDSLTVTSGEFEKGKLMKPLLAPLLNKEGVGAVSFSHTDAYHAWRFESSAEYAYQYITLSPKLYAITKLFIDPVSGTRYGDIVDVEYGHSSAEAVRELYLCACTSLFAQNVDRVTTWALPHTPLFRITQSIGFSVSPRERYFCVSVVNNHYHHLADVSQWNFMQADCEVY